MGLSKLKKIETIIEVDAFGFDEGRVRMWLNPEASVYDRLTYIFMVRADAGGEAVAPTDEQRAEWWKALGQVVLGWNLAYENGERVPLPSEVDGEADLKLPLGMMSHVFRTYTSRVADAVRPPKALEDSSSSTSLTNIEVPIDGKESVHR